MADGVVFSSKLRVLDRADCCVAGGGWAGVCAALACAEAGLETVLVEERGALGWESSHGLDLFLNPPREVPLTLQGVLDVLAGQNAFRAGTLDPVAAECQLDKTLGKAGVRVHFRAFAGGFQPSGGAGAESCAVRVTTKSGPLAIAARCVVDATETARLARGAGARFAAAPAGGPFTHARAFLLCAVAPPAAPETRALDGAELALRPTLWPHEAHVLIRYAPKDAGRAESAGRFLIAKAVERLRAERPGFEKASLSLSGHEAFALEVPELAASSLPEGLFVAGPAALGRHPGLEERAALGEAAVLRALEFLRCAVGK